MAQWQSTLDLKDVWGQYDTADISIQELSKVISERLLKLKPISTQFVLQGRDDLVEDFDDLSHDEGADVDDFDDIMARLYDWGDIRLSGDILSGKKVCWIKTYF